ncbi:MAG: hypothetical protein J5722_12310 [Oscillospiraceae bacterium]|nr:hypothetical protein [Oscillospiraceae bacterium]
MYQEDYIIKQIRQLSRMIAQYVFRIDTQSHDELHISNPEKAAKTSELLRKVDSGNIREAEAELDRMTESRTLDDMLAGIAFYTRIGEKNESFLDDHAYNDVDLKIGLRRFAERFGSKHLAELVMP